jgi:hypothetical protein
MNDRRSRRTADIPEFTPVPVRARRDGWTPARQRAFIAALHSTRSVTKAVEATGMTRESAYRLRSRSGAEGFAAVWDSVFADDIRSTTAAPSQLHRAIHGTRLHFVFEDGSVGTLTRFDNTAALKLLRRMDHAAASRANAALRRKVTREK